MGNTLFFFALIHISLADTVTIQFSRPLILLVIAALFLGEDVGPRRIVAACPLAEMFGYAGDIRSKSQGRAVPSLEPRDYAEVPAGKRPKLF